MPGSPRAVRIRAALTDRAERELGEGAIALDYLVYHLAGGGFLTDLLDGLSEEVGAPVSRTLLSHVAHRLSDDAPQRLKDARREGAGGLVEDAVAIVDTAPTGSREELQKAKMRAGIRTWVAERANPGEYGSTTKLVGQVSIGVAHLEALRRRNVAAARAVPARRTEEAATSAERSGFLPAVSHAQRVSGAELEAPAQLEE